MTFLPQNGPEIKKSPKGGKLKMEDDVMKKTYLRPFFFPYKIKFLPQNRPEYRKPPQGEKLKLEDDLMKKIYLRPFFFPMQHQIFTTK